MKGGHHRTEAFHLELLYFHKAIQVLEIQYLMDFFHLWNLKQVGINALGKHILHHLVKGLQMGHGVWKEKIGMMDRKKFYFVA